nr:hypothetical protein [Bacillus sp. mrc49]
MKQQKADAGDMLDYLTDIEVVKHMGLEPFQTVDEVWGGNRLISVHTQRRYRI